MVARPGAHAFHLSLNLTFAVAQRRANSTVEIELSVAVGKWTRKFEEGSCWGMQLVGL